jgi:hypothetical protein
MAGRFLGVQAVVDGLTDPLLRVGFEWEPPGAAIDGMHARISQVGVERTHRAVPGRFVGRDSEMTAQARKAL